MATNLKSSLLLSKKDVVFIKPENPIPLQVLSFSSIDNDYNLELLCQTLYVYQANDHNEKDPAEVIKEALSRVLVYYYPLAGKLKRGDDGALFITCNGDGVPFLEAMVDYKLSSLNYFEGVDVEIAKKFVFDLESDSDYGYHPLVLQVTKFSCGGFTIGMGLSHSVCDGFGASQFFRAMAELASGKSELTIKPVWERERLLGKICSQESVKFDIVNLPRDVCRTDMDQSLLGALSKCDRPWNNGPHTVHQAGQSEPVNGNVYSVQFENKASLVTSPFLPTTDLVHASFDINNESITRLKSRLLNECQTNEIKIQYFTTLEVLGAYVWRSRFRALKQNLDGNTIFCLTVGIRNLIDPPLPEGYYGNAFVAAQTIMLGKDLENQPLSEVALLIKDSKKKATKIEYIQNSLNIMETMRHNKMKIDSFNGASMALTDWRQLGLLEDVNFRWKDSVNMLPLPWKMFGYVDLCIFMPPCKMNSSSEGGVRVLVSFPREAITKFKEEMDALNEE